MGPCCAMKSTRCAECQKFFHMISPPQWVPSRRACQHCYCQPAPSVGAVAHKKCCKCADTFAADSDYAPNRAVAYTSCADMLRERDAISTTTVKG